MGLFASWGGGGEGLDWGLSERLQEGRERQTVPGRGRSPAD